MTAYGAVNSLRNTIDYILYSSHFSLVDPSPHIIQSAYEELQPLQEILERLDSTRTSKSRKKVNALDGKIKELIWEFQDLLESLVYQQILSQVKDEGIMKERVWDLQGLLESLPSQVEDEGMKEVAWGFRSLPSHPQIPRLHHATTTRRRRLVVRKPKGRNFNTPKIMSESEASQSRSLADVGGERLSIDLHSLRHHVPSFIHALKYTKREYIYELLNMAEDDEDESIYSRIGTKSKMIGLSDQFQQLKESLMKRYGRNHFFALVGTAGIGKTALAEAVFEDPEILSHFQRRAWVTVGRKSRINEFFLDILDQIYGITQGDDERLQGEKCLIVLDDVWERQMDSVMGYFQYKFDASIHILVTTRDRNTTFTLVHSCSIILVRFLNQEESKELLCEKVFGENICPFQLDKAATKIAKNCEGLPLVIVTVADILSKAQNTDPKYWDDVAEMRNSVFTDAYNEISKVLFPSYNYLPQYLKMPFLYMGVFPRDYDIPLSKIMNMLATEGLFHNKSLEDSVSQCLEELCMYRNLALFSLTSIYRYSSRIVSPKYKTCRLHSSWQHVCRGEAQKNKFYHVLKKLVEGLEDGVKGQRCLCLENNLLFGIKDFRKFVRLNCASSTRSLLFFGPYHQYPIPVGDDFKLLRKLDALKLRLYTFPTEILTLVLLKYLALTCNGELPTTISKLFNLQVLIIHPHSNIRICRAPSYVPIQIWDMQELEHIEILGKSLVAPCHFASLKKLSTLVGVNASICTILELSQKVPCLRKLGVQIDLTPYDDHNDLLSCFGCISTLENLETLKCSIINPVVKYNYVFPSSLLLPRGLKKLHLSGMGFSWEYMDVIGSLPFLEVLKLRAYAFWGSTWEARKRSFLRLKFLLIEDSDLVQWKARSGSFPNLICVNMKHCYKLEEIHWPSEISFNEIELVNCNPLALTSVKQLQLRTYASLEVTAFSSFDKKPITIKFMRRYDD
ncbi:putative late blight resistance protein homolog R1C-3 [Salvia miltiorrhiza]|uniref:putative late blight resistance protein homolog R1C-3 n=1 Tax=Salvia miltiorrhiza TaxID=226208 RepID=UPI0025AD774E|nr:putative late blight resistance protein homolog R1C-3 [Salvia miltiorrhiza]XP_057786826.1 putative late blight resistance protein homolog R1C-3 [Salvia miltiorrhiza]